MGVVFADLERERVYVEKLARKDRANAASIAEKAGMHIRKSPRRSSL
jgi:hypothetical protein